MKKRYVRGAGIVLSIIGALVFVAQLYAVLPDCTTLSNLCTQTCGGDVTYWVYGGGGSAIECDDAHSPCQTNWGPVDCDDW